LDEILAELYAEGRLANQETAEEIIKRLEARKNYIPSSEVVRREYRHLLLEKYKEYMSARAAMDCAVWRKIL
jgi:L-alanine-DL-glutamate epimerase-like enolase superfamily enzyme